MRQTASDRPGVAQPVPEREIPAKPWTAMLATVVVLVVLAVGAWEWRMRDLGLSAGDLGDYPSAWAAQRRRLDVPGVSVAIIGDSRILFGTNVDHFERVAGVRPVQLAIPGTNSRFMLESIANRSSYSGLVIVGITELNYFSKNAGRGADAMKRYEFESPSQWTGQVIYDVLARRLAFLDENYRLSKLVRRLDHGWRQGAPGDYVMPWKLYEVGEQRATHMWAPVERPGFVQDHARAVWMGQPPRKFGDDELADTVRRTRDAVAKIRARGGEVVFLRPPSAEPLYAQQSRQLPRERGWDPLLRDAGVQGVYFEDVPQMRGLVLPEYAHLSAACAIVYTDAYLRALARLTPRLPLRADAPPPLAPKDCAAPP